MRVTYLILFMVFTCALSAQESQNVQNYQKEEISGFKLYPNPAFGDVVNVITKDNKLKIGHGMCGGPLVFARDDEYKIRFKNNMQANSDSWTNWIPYQNPANNPFNKK